MNTQPNPTVLENSENLSFWNSQPDFTPFTPNNSNEAYWLYKNWCSKCRSTQYQDCSILIQMYAVGEQPKEVFFFNNIPICDKFTPCQN